MIEVPFGAAIALACFLLIAGGLAGYRLSWMDAYDKATKDFELARLLWESRTAHLVAGGTLAVRRHLLDAQAAAQAAVSTWPAPRGGSARIVGVGHTVADNATAPHVPLVPLD